MNSSSLPNRLKAAILITGLFFVYANSLSAQQSLKVLFLGNSYTGTNDLPGMVRYLATSMGDTLMTDQNTPGGYTFELHSNDPNSLNKIGQDNWDVVVLQEQSQKPSFNPTFVASEVYPYATQLDDFIKNNDSCSRTMFYMTWGRRDGDQGNCASYPPICTYEGMQARLRTSYMEMAQSNEASVAPVGVAWKKTREDHPTINLYVADGSHPSVAGTYLAACVFYAGLFGESPVGSDYYATLDSNTAGILQQIAGSTVLDSFALWRLDQTLPVSDFTWTTSNDSVFFNNLSLDATEYMWDFGDGNTSSDVNPTHVYTQSGDYNVQLTALTDCFEDVITDSISIVVEPDSSTGIIRSLAEQFGLEVGPNPTTGKIWLTLKNGTNREIQLEVFDPLGRHQKTFQNPFKGNAKTVAINLEGQDPGLYLLSFSSGQYREVIKVFLHP